MKILIMQFSPTSCHFISKIIFPFYIPMRKMNTGIK
jgi:hypothetical protein